jgi:hypothetical protein
MVVASSISSKQDVFDDVFVDEEDGEHFPELIPASTSSTSTHKRKRIDEDEVKSADEVNDCEYYTCGNVFSNCFCQSLDRSLLR